MQLFCLAQIVFVLSANAQSDPNSGSYGKLLPYHPAPPHYLGDLFATVIEPKPYADIEGSVFLDENWMLASLVLPGNKVIDSISIRMNLFENKIHFKDVRGKELQAGVPVLGIQIIDTNSKWQNAVFLSGLKEDPGAFFQILSNGNKIKLLKKISIRKWESKSFGVQRKWFEAEEKLFLFANGNLSMSNKNCSILTELFGDNKKILQFISSNNLRCNREEDMKKLVEYFNIL